jgi:hypothetical protein
MRPFQTSLLLSIFSLMLGSCVDVRAWERFFINEGKRYSHILYPMTGWPKRRDLDEAQGWLIQQEQLLTQFLYVLRPIAFGIEPGKALRKCRVLPTAR